MLASEIREMTEGDIQTRINELEEERFRLKFRSATENLEQPLRLRMIRKDVARLKTVLRERELGGQPAPRPARQSRAKRAAAKQSGATKRAPKKARTSSARTTARSAAPKARKQER